MKLKITNRTTETVVKARFAGSDKFRVERKSKSVGEDMMSKSDESIDLMIARQQEVSRQIDGDGIRFDCSINGRYHSVRINSRLDDKYMPFVTETVDDITSPSPPSAGMIIKSQKHFLT